MGELYDDRENRAETYWIRMRTTIITLMYWWDLRANLCLYACSTSRDSNTKERTFCL